MTHTDFTYILEEPQRIDDNKTVALKSVIQEYPYFQTARALHLKALKNAESFRYNQELKTTAAYTTDRSILFDFITSETFLQNAISKQIQKTSQQLKNLDVTDFEDISVNKRMLIDDTFNNQIQDTKGVLDPELFEAKSKQSEESFITPFEIDTTKIETTPEEQLQVGKPLEFNKSETHSFGEWLKLTAFKPIIREHESSDDNHLKTEDTTRDKKFELIDKFIKTNPKIQPVKVENKSQNLAKASNIKPKHLMTETLARVFVEQKNYKKAIQSYKILSLKYPEKSGFFADQIKAVKKLQEKNK